jgi:DMSO/TMAO reductase YedYZ molybdopterin-dependent catalytic subunit
MFQNARFERREWLKRWVGAILAPRSAFNFPGQEPQDRSQKTPPLSREFQLAQLESRLTPNQQFFLRSHLNYPEPDLPGWKLRIEGLVARPLTLRFEELAALPTQSREVTFECAGNPPGGGMVSTAEWRGIALREFLEKAGFSTKATEVVFEGLDFGLDEAESVPLQYARSISLEKALAAETMIAWKMNGQPLSREHGFPARVVVPGYYAMSHVKWLSRIRLVERPFKGFYMVKRYFTARAVPGAGNFEIQPVMKMKVKSQIARPQPGEQLPRGACRITGAAWAGEASATRVEVSTDGGLHWAPAILLDTPAPYVWVRWEYPWTPGSSGAFTLMCRAFDNQGGKQPEAPDPTLINRYGNNWYHRVDVTVR